ncbi:hypothetical protein BU16DRAFT_545560 [Lophium mytilinum]|uniref:BYS1 domain protein n=1 Tax=Lophium mytilinum TaxID=390894 RepID=A0A6A6Q8F6_9PEZI|nr:hypothetical protein BU16DRAFT_545560 [Lophium mytilinum]
MRFTFLLPLLLAPSTLAADLWIYNACGSNPLGAIPIYTVGATTRFEGMSLWEEWTHLPLHHDAVTGGVSLKFGDFEAGQPHLELNYNVDDAAGRVFYTLENVNGALFDGRLVELRVPGCPGVSWLKGSGEGVGTLSCEGGASLVLSFCGTDYWPRRGVGRIHRRRPFGG